ncbi:assimilatory sulfite reductase (NADPH) flavoprotein subunit [Dyella sp. LX-66]|uniref:assimilatory sulfite reductase (NADPH) flavoprotein subunit n=1 Tax=unclassified Dyella TaxID=2634549 RepID=UPI001BE04451|nr:MULTISPECIES: assimilatory sulfite reductase (NADPH) flavoprotein subunit [unclassified Dyella]MBT2116650.1 assimilatory sulfite reductase (NADPH) flavoprotein subunit [Dyella sp. LX-1]MBT2139170.1 assimilatory sulfite reductase (NADPH) flavoprotein subunit [Dyella sp. LX-66]
MNAVVSQESLASPLAADKAAQLQRLLEGLAPHELYWVAARSAALAARGPQLAQAQAQAVAAAAATERVTVLYGSQTGNAKRVAEQLLKKLEAAGLPARLVRADAYVQRELAQERQLFLVISTQGEGEPPDDARGLIDFIASRRAPRLPSLRYAVLGLGDSSYPQFCAIGRQLDARLEELGAARLDPLAEADVDLDEVAAPWTAAALERARELLKAPAAAVRAPLLQAVPTHAVHDRDNPFAATVLANQRIVSRDSEREVLHVELSLEGSGLSYRPGDALGVWPRNPPALVRQWLELLQLDGDADVAHNGRTLPLVRWLTEERELTRLARGFALAHARTSGDAGLARALEDPVALTTLLDTHQPIDLLRRYPAPWEAAALVAALRPLTPRLYSIASSSAVVGDEVHLTVSTVDYEAFGERHWGAASAFLAASAEDARLPVFIEANERFRLPADNARDVIMIGPGTGVAPFRGFVQERHETGASGRNWLFFGNRHFADDFLYQVEWQEALKQGALHRLDLAFSRDGAGKVYVQHRLREHGKELYAWLSGGAHLYVCGDATHMAKDVHAALVDIAAEHGGLSHEDAGAWLADLLQQGRYARDVY